MLLFLRFLLFVIFLNIAGCHKVVNKPDPRNEMQLDSAEIDSEHLPLDLELIKESNDGQLLSLVFRLVNSAKQNSLNNNFFAAIYSDSMTVSISLFSDGVRALKATSSLTEVILLEDLEPLGKKLASNFENKELLLQVNLPDDIELTDYQLTLQWSQNNSSGDRLIKAAAVKRGSRVCESNSCKSDYELQLDLINPYDRAVQDIRVQTWYAAESITKQEEDKASILLEGVMILPGQTAGVVLHFASSLPEDLENIGYVPQFKVQGFEFVD